MEFLTSYENVPEFGKQLVISTAEVKCDARIKASDEIRILYVGHTSSSEKHTKDTQRTHDIVFIER